MNDYHHSFAKSLFTANDQLRRGAKHGPYSHAADALEGIHLK